MSLIIFKSSLQQFYSKANNEFYFETLLDITVP